MTEALSTKTALNGCRVVLVRPSHPGNIGATARAMKTMGLHSLYLVNPKRFPDEEATSRAAHAVDLLEKAICCDSLQEALVGTIGSYALSCRKRDIAIDPAPIGKTVSMAASFASQQQPVAFVFGNESTGLTNEELSLCKKSAYIPTDETFASLNLASAVQVVCYDYRLACLALADFPGKTTDINLASHEDYEGFYGHLEQALSKTQFLESGHSERIMRRLRRLFDRTCADKKEMMILRGILTAFERQMAQAKGDLSPQD